MQNSKPSPTLRFSDRPARRWSAILGSLLLASGVGCQSSPFGDLSLWPIEAPDKTSFVTPSQRVEKLDELRGRAARAGADERQRVATELANQIRSEQDPIVREQIIRTITEYDSPATRAVLRSGIHDTDLDVRIACCDSLGRFGDPESTAALAEVLQSDPDIDVRLAATQALAKMKRPDTVKALAVALDDPDPALQYRAVQALREVSDQDLGNDVVAWREFVRRDPASAPTSTPPSIADRAKRLFLY